MSTFVLLPFIPFYGSAWGCEQAPLGEVFDIFYIDENPLAKFINFLFKASPILSCKSLAQRDARAYVEESGTDLFGLWCCAENVKVGPQPVKCIQEVQIPTVPRVIRHFRILHPPIRCHLGRRHHFAAATPAQRSIQRMIQHMPYHRLQTAANLPLPNQRPHPIQKPRQHAQVLNHG